MLDVNLYKLQKHLQLISLMFIFAIYNNIKK